jgi:hypothetical protein
VPHIATLPRHERELWAYIRATVIAHLVSDCDLNRVDDEDD